MLSFGWQYSHLEGSLVEGILVEGFLVDGSLMEGSVAFWRAVLSCGW